MLAVGDREMTGIWSRWYDQAYKSLTGQDIKANSWANIPKRIVSLRYWSGQNQLTIEAMRVTTAITQWLSRNVPEAAVSRLQTAAAAALDYPLLQRLANLVTAGGAGRTDKSVVQEVRAELEFFQDFAPVANAIKEQGRSSPTFRNKLYVSLPRFNVGRWRQDNSPVDKLAYALTDASQYLDLVENPTKCRAVSLPRLFYASLAKRGENQSEACALRVVLFTSCQVPVQYPSERSLVRFDEAEKAVVKAMGTTQQTLAEYVEGAEKLLGWVWPGNFETAGEFIFKYRISRFSMIGRLVVTGNAVQCQKNMKDICSSRRFAVECGNFDSSDSQLNVSLMLEMYAHSMPIVDLIMLVSAAPSSRVLTSITAGNIRGNEPDESVSSYVSSLGNKTAALDPLRLYLCYRGALATCEEFERKHSMTLKFFANYSEFLSVVETVWSSLRAIYGESRKVIYEGIDESELRDIAFFKGVAELDPTPWFVEGRELKGGLLVVMYDFYMAGVLEWPLFHRMLVKLAPNLELSPEQVEKVIREEIAMFIKLRPFLEIMQGFCRDEVGNCKPLHEIYVNSPPVGNEDLGHYLAEFLESTGSSSQTSRQHFPSTVRTWPPEDPFFRNALQPDGSLPRHVREKQVYWIRLTKILEAAFVKAELFGKVNPEQFVQGYLGDCWLVAALSSAAEYPDFVKGSFETKDVDERGVYVVNINDGGELRKIIVNDLIPCTWENKDGFLPVFMRPTDNSMWAVLFEKAFAMLRGGYGNLVGGVGKEAFQAFNRDPVEKFEKMGEGWVDSPLKSLIAAKLLYFSPPSFRNVLTQYLLKHHSSYGYLVTASIGITALIFRPDRVGLIAQHAYAVLRIATIQSPEKREVTLIKLRNPHGRNEWTKEWSDSSSEWNEEYLEQLDHTLGNDGVFWMPLERFLQYFDDIEVSCSILKTTCARRPIETSP